MEYTALLCSPAEGAHTRDILISLLAGEGFESFEENDDGSLRAYIPSAAFTAELAEKLSTPKFSPFLMHFAVEHFPDRNWNEVWESQYQPVTIDGRCMVRAPFHQPMAGIEFDIVIMPKMSFGTAHHETTKLMIRYLLDTDVDGRLVLDMGSGTGVLAILAAMKGAASITAIDNDEWAYRNALENVSSNNFGNIEVLLGNSSLLAGRKFDVVLANINRNILLADIPAYRECLTPGGLLFMSGFYDSDLAVIAAAAEAAGMKLVSSMEENRWTAAMFKLPV